MIGSKCPTCRERGMVLVSSLLLLLVVTLLAVSMFRSFGLDEKIAGNTRDKQLALQAAQSAEQYAESYLANDYSLAVLASANASLPSVNCAGPISTTVNICSNPLASPSSLPWAAGATYTIQTNGTTGGVVPANPPVFYIYALSSTGPPYQFRIDAVGYGNSPNTVALVEVIYSLQCTTCSN